MNESLHKPRILLLSLYYPPDLSAGAFRADALANALLTNTDCELEILTAMPNRYTSWSPQSEQLTLAENILVHRLQLTQRGHGLFGQSLSMLEFMRKVRKAVRGKQYDLVVATSSRLMTAVLGAVVARQLRAALYLDIRDIFVESLTSRLTGWRWRPLLALLGKLERWTLNQADRINLVSPGFDGYFLPRYPGRNFSHFTNGIDPLFIRNDWNQSTPLSSFSTFNKPISIVYAGNIGDGQGLHLIVPQLAQQLGTRAHLRIIGDGGQANALRAALQRQNITNVELLSPVSREQLLDHYRKADVLFLHLNDVSAFRRVLPSKLFEYAATGKPILAGVTGYAADFINSELSNTAVFDPLNAAAAEAKLLCLQPGWHDRSQFIRRYARSQIMLDMKTDILRLAKRSAN